MSETFCSEVYICGELKVNCSGSNNHTIVQYSHCIRLTPVYQRKSLRNWREMSFPALHPAHSSKLAAVQSLHRVRWIYYGCKPPYIRLQPGETTQSPYAHLSTWNCIRQKISSPKSENSVTECSPFWWKVSRGSPWMYLQHIANDTVCFHLHPCSR